MDFDATTQVAPPALAPADSEPAPADAAPADASPLEGALPVRTPGVRGTHAGEFARVYELAEARRRRMTGPDSIPEEVWDDISRAGQLAQDLHAQGRGVRFDTHHLTGRIVASLCDLEGNVVRRLTLREVLHGPDYDPEPASAA
jgi:hypothetical protein